MYTYAKQPELKQRVARRLEPPVEKIVPAVEEGENVEEKEARERDDLMDRFASGAVAINKVDHSCRNRQQEQGRDGDVLTEPIKQGEEAGRIHCQAWRGER